MGVKKKGLRKRRGVGGILQREPLSIGRRECFCRIVKREREREREWCGREGANGGGGGDHIS
jgi:hypothetical protein